MKYLNGVTSIGSDVFEGCRNLQEMIIPEGIEYLGELRSEDYVSLKKITIYRTEST